MQMKPAAKTDPSRSDIMRAVKSKNTSPELVVRRILHSAGYRYQLHVRSLPGSPDIAFPGRRKAIFVHGCFWHGHECRAGRLPESRRDYWVPKIARNARRDEQQIAALREQGWEVMVVWECETRPSGRATLNLRLFSFVGSRMQVKRRT